MSEQQVLDMACGSRMFWFDPKDDRAVFMDNRKESHRLKDSSSRNGERMLVITEEALGTLGDTRELKAALSYAQGQLDEFLRMKKERPIVPVYWDMHEENRLRAAVEGL